MNTYIVNETSTNIRALARQSLKGHWKSAALAVLIYTICTEVPAIIIYALFGGFSEEALMSEEFFTPGDGLVSVYSILVAGAFTFGLTVYFLDLIRLKKTDTGMIFSGFGYYFKTMGLYVVMSVLIILWTLLLIVPGIIAAFRYSQAFYILADDPSKGVMQCIRESKEMMKGNKANYLWLQLSFIGWYVLTCAGIVIASVIAVTVAIVAPGDASFVIAMAILGIGVVVTLIGIMFLMPYVMAATTIFYEMANGNLRKATEELPPLSQSVPEITPPLSRQVPEIKQETVEISAPEANEEITYTEPKIDNNNDSVNNDKVEL